MKKYSILLLFLMGLCMISNVLETKAKTVLQTEVYNHYYMKEIIISTPITSKTIQKYVTNLKILEVTCSVPKIYQNKLPGSKTYTFSFHVSIRQNFIELEKKYQLLYKEHGFIKQSESVYFYGVPLSKIKVYGSEEEIQKLENILIK